jgi:transposase-like protein
VHVSDAGQRVLAAMMEADRVALCGPKGVPDEGRRTVRGGSTASRVVLGGQRIAVRRLRARSLEDGEQALPTFKWAAAADPLHAATLAAIAAGVSTRRYAATQEPVPAVHRPSAASKSAVSRRFVKLSQEQLKDWLGRRLDGLDLPVVIIQRCQEHKRLNVIEHLPKDMQPSVKRALREAWSAGDDELARRQLTHLAGSLQARHPGAAASLREGLEETLTVQALGMTGALYRTLRSTNPIENLNGLIAHHTRNVKHWKDGQMVLRWVASALADAATRMRKLRGCAQMKSLLKALDAKAAELNDRPVRKAA